VVRDFAAGVIDAGRGALYLVRHRRLWKWVVAPAVVVALIGAVTFGWLIALLGAIGLVKWSSIAIAGATVIVTIGSLVAGPFGEMLSEALEELAHGVPPPSFSAGRFLWELAVGIAHAVRRGVPYVATLGVLLLVGRVVPVIGGAIATGGGAWVTARYASYGAYDAIWARRHWRYHEKLAYLRERRWRTLGLGAAVAVTLVVPGVNVIGLAIGAAGGTLRVLAEEREAGARARQPGTI
jgi:CysZ protein